MVIHEYGDSSLPKIVLLHPMMADARYMLRLTESMEGKYCAIIPDLSGQGEDSGERLCRRPFSGGFFWRSAARTSTAGRTRQFGSIIQASISRCGRATGIVCTCLSTMRSMENWWSTT